MIKEAAGLYFHKNSLIVDVLEMLLQIEPTKRLTCEEILQTLPDYDQIQYGFDKISYKEENGVPDSRMRSHERARSHERSELGRIEEHQFEHINTEDYLINENDYREEEIQARNHQLNQNGDFPIVSRNGLGDPKMLTEEEFFTMHAKPKKNDLENFKQANSRTQFYVTKDPEVIEVIDERPSSEGRFSSQRPSYSPRMGGSRSPKNENYSNPASVGNKIYKDQHRIISEHEMHQEAQGLFPRDVHTMPRRHQPVILEEDTIRRQNRRPVQREVIEYEGRVQKVREYENKKVTYVEHPPREVYRERSRSKSRSSHVHLADDDYITNEFLDTEKTYNMHRDDPYFDHETINPHHMQRPPLLSREESHMIDKANKDLGRQVVDLRAQLDSYHNPYGIQNDQTVVGKRIGMENPMKCYSNLAAASEDDPYIFKPELIQFDKNIGLSTQDIHRKYIDSFEPNNRNKKKHIVRNVVKDKKFYTNEKKQKLQDRKTLYAKYTNVNNCVKDRVKHEMKQNVKNLRKKQKKVDDAKPTPVVKEEIRAGLMKNKHIDKTYMKDAWDSELSKKLWHYNKSCLRNPDEKLKENYYPVNNSMYHVTRDCFDTFPSKEERISISRDRRRFFCTQNGKINDHKCTVGCICCEEYDECNVKHIDAWKHSKYHDTFNHKHMGHSRLHKQHYKHIDHYSREKGVTAGRNLRSGEKERHSHAERNVGHMHHEKRRSRKHHGHKTGSNCCEHCGPCECGSCNCGSCELC